MLLIYRKICTNRRLIVKSSFWMVMYHLLRFTRYLRVSCQNEAVTGRNKHSSKTGNDYFDSRGKLTPHVKFNIQLSILQLNMNQILLLHMYLFCLSNRQGERDVQWWNGHHFLSPVAHVNSILLHCGHVDEWSDCPTRTIPLDQELHPMNEENVTNIDNMFNMK